MEASHPEQGTLHAWVEGELDGAEHERIEAHLAGCARCREAVAEARGLIAGASRIVAALDGAPAGVVVPSRVRRPRFVPARWAAAAAVLLFAATSVVVSREFTSRGSEFPTAANDIVAPSGEGVASAPVLAPAAGAEQQPSAAITNAATGRRSAAPSAREPMSTVAGERARAPDVREGAVARVEQTRQLADTAAAVAVADRLTSEADFARTGVAGQAAGQIATTGPAVPAPRQAALPASVEQAAPPAALQPMQIRVSGIPSGRVVRVVRYEARPGVVVTFTEYEELPQRGAARTGAAAPMRAQGEDARQELPVMRSPRPFEGSIYAWRHPDGGRFYTLHGPLSEAELESLARRLGELKVVR